MKHVFLILGLVGLAGCMDTAKVSPRQASSRTTANGNKNPLVLLENISWDKISLRYWEMIKSESSTNDFGTLGPQTTNLMYFGDGLQGKAGTHQPGIAFFTPTRTFHYEDAGGGEVLIGFYDANGIMGPTTRFKIHLSDNTLTLTNTSNNSRYVFKFHSML